MHKLLCLWIKKDAKVPAAVYRTKEESDSLNSKKYATPLQFVNLVRNLYDYYV